MTENQKLSELISSAEIVIFSKDYCPFCTKAKELLQKYITDKLKMKIYDIGKEFSYIRDELISFTEMRTVPQVFIKGEKIGGYDDTAKLENDGILKTLLEK